MPDKLLINTSYYIIIILFIHLYFQIGNLNGRVLLLKGLNMKRKSKKYLYAMTAFTSLMTAPGAMAHISPNAFKNVTRHL